jgi:hypothetical protein
MTNWTERLLEAIDRPPNGPGHRLILTVDVDELERLAAEARTALAQPESDPSQLSDGFHTFAELYEHRHALYLALMRAMPEHCWFSWRHADGERCFGGDDWFIAGIELPAGASVTYHMPAELFQIAQATGAAELEKGRPWDGHSAADVVLRLKAWAALAQPQPEGVSDGELLRTYGLAKRDHCYEGPIDDWPRRAERAATVHGLRAILTRYARPTIEPVAVAERLPGPEDCAPWPGEPDATHWAWAGKCVDGGWEWSQLSMVGLGSNTLGRIIAGGGWTHWARWDALPVPGAEVG